MSRLRNYQLFSKINLDIRIVKAEGLPAMDKSGTSDPFCTFTFSRRKKKTRTIKKTLDPVWNTTFSFINVPTQKLDPQLEILTYDWNLFSSNDYIGRSVINLKQLFHNVTFTDQGLSAHGLACPIMGANKESQGKLFIVITFKIIQLSPPPKMTVGESIDIPTSRCGRMLLTLKSQVESTSIVDVDLSAIAFLKSKPEKAVFPVYYANKEIDGLKYIGRDTPKMPGFYQVLLEVEADPLRLNYDIVVFIVSISKSIEDENDIVKFSDLSTCEVQLMDPDHLKSIMKLQLNDIHGTCAILGVLDISDTINSTFVYNPQLYPKKNTNYIPHHWGDIYGEVLQYVKNNHIQSLKYFSPQDKIMLLKKGETLGFQQIHEIAPTFLESFTIGLGWDMKGTEPIDLDASVIMLTETNDSQIVYFRKKTSDDNAIKHSGDNTTGEGEGDDEQIQVELFNVDPKYTHLAVVITSFKGDKFSTLENAYTRLFTGTNSTFLRYDLDDLGDYTAIVVGIFHRTKEGWSFEASGFPAKGTEPCDLVECVQNMF
ncbi:camp-binding protein [Anaeramoeba flamelloides]|uniref:Camp-binding protein n=1 Tax=Anaeramoeba flamelloides TaxID=1746091 RepID=A0ABQ8Y3E1_9EUKA|nr:camp-binding protein [Anaeramoeba flamelloides]